MCVLASWLHNGKHNNTEKALTDQETLTKTNLFWKAAQAMIHQ